MSVTFKSLVEGEVLYSCSKTSKGWVVLPLEVLSIEDHSGRVLIRKAGSVAEWHYAPYFESVRRFPPEWVLGPYDQLICYLCKGPKITGHKLGCTHPKAPKTQEPSIKPLIDIDPDPSKPPLKIKFDVSEVAEKIRKGHYVNNLPWSDKLGAAHDAIRLTYMEEEARILERFKLDSLSELRLIVKLDHYDPTKYPICHCTGEVGNVTYKHPKADLLFELAKVYTQEDSFKDTWKAMQDFVKLLR